MGRVLRENTWSPGRREVQQFHYEDPIGALPQPRGTEFTNGTFDS